MTKIVCISDTHNQHNKINMPDGDILIHAGDFTYDGYPPDVKDFNDWLGELPYKHKIVIAGNHERTFENSPELVLPLLTNCIYLQDSEVTIDGLRIYGSPHTPWFGNWAFNKMRGQELKDIWSLIPYECDIVATHGPPYGCGDRLITGDRVGDADLLRALEEKRPKYHISGDIHCGYGLRTLNKNTRCINAAICNEAYEPVNKPIVIEL